MLKRKQGKQRNAIVISILTIQLHLPVNPNSISLFFPIVIHQFLFPLIPKYLSTFTSGPPFYGIKMNKNTPTWIVFLYRSKKLGNS